MFKFLKIFSSKSNTTQQGGWKKLSYDKLELSYPDEYTILREGGPFINGFCREPGKTIGVLRFTPIQLDRIEVAEELFLSARETNPQGVETKIGNHTCWLVTEEKKHSSNDYIFWKDTGEPILMESYFFAHKNTFFLFSYRIPLSMTKNGMREQEKPTILKVMESTRTVE